MYEYIINLNIITLSLFLGSFLIVNTSINIKKNNKRNIIQCILLLTISIMKSVHFFQNESMYISSDLIYYNFCMMFAGDMIILLLMYLIFKEDKNSKVHRILFLVSYIICIISYYFSFNRTHINFNSFCIIFIIFLNVYLFFNKYSKIIQAISLFYIINFIILLEIDTLNVLIYSNNILDFIFSLIIFVRVFMIYVELPNNRYLKILSMLSRSNINIKIYDEKLNNSRMITKLLKDDFKAKEKNLDTLLGQFGQSALLINNDNYIINNDIVFKSMFKQYENEDFPIKLDDFLSDNIVEYDKFLQSIDDARYYTENVIIEITGKDGRIFDCVISLYEEYESSSVLCILSDITIERKITLKIQESNIKYKKIVKNIPYSIILEKNKEIIYNNNNLDIDLDNQEVKNIILNDATKGEINYTHDNGEEISLYIDRIKFEEYGEKLSLIEIKDITKHKNILSRLEASTNQYKTLIDTIPEAICVLDYESKAFEYANNTFYNLFKIQDIENMDLDEIYNDIAISSGNINENIKYMQKSIKDGYGGIVHIESCVVLIDINKSTKMVLIIRDITEEVRVESMKREIEESEIINKDMDDFFINMSHELLTPANLLNMSNKFILRNCKDIIKREPEGEFAKYIDVMNKHVDILTILIDKIMELSKLETNYYKDAKDTYDLVCICEDIVTELNKYTINKGINIIFDTEEEEVYVEIDQDNITKAILALISLVIKNSRLKSTININMRTKGDKVIVSIENFGRYDHKKHFYNYDEKILNLSMSISKLIINLYKGKIDIKTNIDDSIIIEVELNIERNVKEYDIVSNTIDQNFIYNEYKRLCDF